MFVVDTEEGLEELTSNHMILLVNLAQGPALLWSNEDGEWHGTRPVAEDDGEWKDIPAASRETLAVRVDVDLNDPESALPLTVLWPPKGENW